MELDKEKVQRVAQMLESASSLLRDAAVPSSSNSDPQSSERPSRQSTNVAGPLQSALDHARSMIRNSTNSGTCRRLNRAERLRAAAPVNLFGRKKQPAKKGSKKAFECALLKCFGDDDDNEDHNLKWDSTITQGIILLGEDDDEKAVREAIKDLFTKKIPILGANDFDFVKVKQKKITSLDLGTGAEYNFSVVKKLCGQGLLYVKIKEGFEFLYEEESSTDDGKVKGATDDKLLVPALSGFDDDKHHLTLQDDQHGDHQDSNTIDEAQPPNKTDEIVDIISSKSLSDPVEILRLLQQKLIKGRKLDVTNIDLIVDSSESDKATNFICVDRQNILKTTFSELESVEDFCITFEVDFMGEVAKDYGGPRKEWIRLMNSAMKKKYFDAGLREYIAEEYYHVGIMIGIALLQNGQLPTILPLDIIENLVKPSTDKCIENLKRGLNKFGLCKIMEKAPTFLHLLRPNSSCLTAKIIIQMLSPLYAPEGSTAFSREKEIYSLFVKYVREVASGRRHPINLSSILIFVTGAAEEPVLGFEKQPTITFVQSSGNNQVHYTLIFLFVFK